MWDPSGFHLRAFSLPLVHWIVKWAFNHTRVFIWPDYLTCLCRKTWAFSVCLSSQWQRSPSTCATSSSHQSSKFRHLRFVPFVTSAFCVVIGDAWFADGVVGKHSRQADEEESPSSKKTCTTRSRSPLTLSWTSGKTAFTSQVLCFTAASKTLRNERKPVPRHHLPYSFVGFF